MYTKRNKSILEFPYVSNSSYADPILQLAIEKNKDIFEKVKGCEDMATQAHLDGNKRYLDKMDDIKVRVPKGTREIWRRDAERNGKSLQRYIIDAVVAYGKSLED